jgi:2-hydroxy-3-keto-5-methylthiopentenyl-1-phosphate phosphatase
MAYSADSLSNIATTSGNNLWFYKTADAIATVNTANYFNDAIGMIRKHDVIIVVSSTGGTPAINLVYAKDVTSTAIDVTDGLAITATDTD